MGASRSGPLSQPATAMRGLRAQVATLTPFYRQRGCYIGTRWTRQEQHRHFNTTSNTGKDLMIEVTICGLSTRGLLSLPKKNASAAGGLRGL
ncbi:hypothetical protein E2C01_097408 [Portunus trituberculatus]|uniref:Uncharacterized protein n=1 Tax=Portunus trituberculatus TaxID=210409 RepID=A0A5B7K0C6_PORTR|nr:hypothetical protein [Portunus trituberculatus]